MRMGNAAPNVLTSLSLSCFTTYQVATNIFFIDTFVISHEIPGHTVSAIAANASAGSEQSLAESR